MSRIQPPSAFWRVSCLFLLLLLASGPNLAHGQSDAPLKDSQAVVSQTSSFAEMSLQREESATAYAARIGELVGRAAGLEHQLNQMNQDVKRYLDVADYSSDGNEQHTALTKAEALIRTIPHVKTDYYGAENALISLRARDGQLFDDAMRVAISTPEVDPIIRAYCRKLIGE